MVWQTYYRWQNTSKKTDISKAMLANTKYIEAIDSPKAAHTRSGSFALQPMVRRTSSTRYPRLLYSICRLSTYLIEYHLDINHIYLFNGKNSINPRDISLGVCKKRPGGLCYLLADYHFQSSHISNVRFIASTAALILLPMPLQRSS